MCNRRIAPVVETHRIITAVLPLAHSKDRQLSLMLLINISIYVIFTLVLSYILTYQQITQYNYKSLEEI